MGIRQTDPTSLGGRALSRLLRMNVHLARAHYHYRLRRKCHQYGEPPLLLYQMGKVGSKTIQRSLRTVELDRPVFHVHFLTPDRVEKTEKERRKYLRVARSRDLNANEVVDLQTPEHVALAEDARSGLWQGS